jgi:hypothetical protein
VLLARLARHRLFQARKARLEPLARKVHKAWPARTRQCPAPRAQMVRKARKVLLARRAPPVRPARRARRACQGRQVRQAPLDRLDRKAPLDRKARQALAAMNSLTRFTPALSTSTRR